jgi:predicted site-specific integrase-resolvase
MLDRLTVFGVAAKLYIAAALSWMRFTSSTRWASACGGRAMQVLKAQLQSGQIRRLSKLMPRKELTKAIAYFRTSSATNVGRDKDSLKRQRAAVLTSAKPVGYEIAEEFYDAAVSGADAIDERSGFAATLQRLLGNGVRTIIVETASRFARDLIVQETEWRFLRNADVTLIAADSPDSFLDETPTAFLVCLSRVKPTRAAGGL